MKEATKRNTAETAVHLVFVSRAGGDCIAGNVARNLLFGRQKHGSATLVGMSTVVST